MRSRYNIIAVLVFYCSLLIVNCSLSFAQWSTDPNVNLQVSTWGQYPVACTDGEGGVYIRWEQNSYTTDQYIQHVNKYGYVQWTTPVEVYGTQNGTVFEGKICPDDSNGVIVLFTEWNVNGGDPQYFTHKRVRVNRLDSNGNKLWGEYGVRVSMRDTSQALREIVTDGQKGCIVAFLIAPDSLYVQRISSTGQRLWGEEGIFVEHLHISNNVIVVSDNNNGVIMQYWDGSARFVKLDSNGSIVWSIPNDVGYSMIRADNYGGLLMSTNRYLYGEDRIIVNRMNSDGTFRWGNYGITLVDTVRDYSYVNDMKLRTDSILVVYWNHTKDVVNDYQAKLQMITPQGNILLDSNGISPSNTPVSKRSIIGFVISENNDCLFLFGDAREEEPFSIYAQKIGPNGNYLWSADSLFTYRLVRNITVLSDHEGGIIRIGSDEPLYGIFAHHMNKNGNIGSVISIDNNISKEPNKLLLYQNHPNPFNSSTSIKYYLNSFSQVELSVYNILGEKVCTLFKGKQNSGFYNVSWNGKNHTGNNVSSGIYLYRLVVDGLSKTGKMTLLK